MTKQTYNNIWDAIEPNKVIAANLKVRSELMIRIAEKIKEKGYSQKTAAKILEVTQPRVSDLINGHVELFSIDTLVNMLAALDVDVEIKTHNHMLCAA
jgi:predicted XRE-type DNA-binding protein